MASSAGTIIEWYDFFIFGSLATIISTEFFPKGNPVASFLATLATFSAGLIVRPLGALIFGRLGDIAGRKYTFLVTLIIMGMSTVGMGLVPGYEVIGYFAPLIVLLLRLLQGLALGGEYGGAATYVAEHAPIHRRGFFTSWIQTTSGLAFVLSILAVLFFKGIMPEDKWLKWGWRLPFVASVFLVAISIFIRSRMAESPLFAEAKLKGRTSKNPIKESFGNKANLKTVLLAFLGITFGGGAIGWITFYAQSFMLKTLMLDFNQTNEVIIIGILSGTPFFLVFGWLSDKIGRKNIILLGMLLGLFSFKPLFDNMYEIVKKYELPTNTVVDVKRSVIQNMDSTKNITTETFLDNGGIKKSVEEIRIVNGVEKSDYSVSISVSKTDKWKLILMVFILQFIFTMTYGPLGAYMVEMFPLKIRYTSISFPYHFGFGIFGGLAPYFATYFVEKAHEAGQSDYYLSGLNYPIILTSISLIIGLLYLKNNNMLTANATKTFQGFIKLKRWLGIIWMLLGILVAWFGIIEYGIPKIVSGETEDIIFGMIITLIITPVSSLALLIFGFFALKGVYDT